MLTRLLQTYDAQTAPIAQTGIEDARRCVLQAIAAPRIFETSHLLDMAAVRALETADARLYRLLQIFSREGVADYAEFHAQHAAYMESLGASYRRLGRACARRATTLSALCARRTVRPVT